MSSRRIPISLGLITLICFFLPWIQLSCGTSESRLSGVDLARDGKSALWLIPVLMLAVLFLGIRQARQNKQGVSALIHLVAGLVSAYLMNRERMRANDTSGLITVGLTGWFWLGFGATIMLVIHSAVRLLKHPRIAK